MKTARLALLCVGLFAIAGCEDAPRPAAPKKEPSPEASLHTPIEKAKAVEDQMMRAKEAQDAKLEEQGG